MTRPFTILFVMLILTGCFKSKSTFDKNGTIENLGVPIKVEYFKHLSGTAFQFSDTATFVITDILELKTVINEIKNADSPEPWKGAGWNRIKISYPDTIVNINTDNKKIGVSASGAFYDLGKENFITQRMNNK
jgi:hypothetical protein